ncbi:replication initiator [Micromonospora sp. URMC 106]|uniref:replication initiator n=1 Tax=Micromonospora sp. URMC 106 TaxID=3423408 RepID=UPI003F1AA91F
MLGAPVDPASYDYRRSALDAIHFARVLDRWWQNVRRAPVQVASPRAGRPYDLRHAAVSLWLNSGVPATDVAARAGHYVDVLLKVYAKCIDGQEATVNQRIQAALGGLGE